MEVIHRLLAALVSVAVLAAAGATLADQWPTRPILVISPFVAGTINDIVARTVLDPAGSQLGQSFAIENRPGDDGIIGATSVAKARPDGYTLLLTTSSMTASVALHKSPPYDVVHDFAPVAMFGGAPSMLMAAPQKGYTRI